MVKLLINQARDNSIKVIIDPKKLDFSNYKNAHIITPNLGELERAAKIKIKDDGQLESVCKALIKEHNFEFILATKSEKGMSLIGKDSACHIDPIHVENPDVSGAGDTVVATLASCLALGFDVNDKHRETGTQFDPNGIHRITGTKYDLDGNDQHGFDEKGIHKVTKTKFDEEGFDSDGIHKVTKTKFDEDGYDKDGHWEHDEILNILEETMALHTSSIKSLSYLDDREFTIIGVERKDHDENKGIKITTKEEFDIEGEKINKFHTTRQAIVRKFLNDAGEPTTLYNAINQPDNSLKVKIFKRKSASGRDYFDLEQC